MGALPVVPSGLYPSSWVNANGIPKQLAFGWVGIYRLRHRLPRDRQRSGEQLQRGAATRRLADQLRGSDHAGQPGHLHGRGQFLRVRRRTSRSRSPRPSRPAWCRSARLDRAGYAARRVGSTISCTNSTSPFTSGIITVNGVVTSSSLTPASVRNATSALVSSGDASPATSSSAPAGTVPTAPNVTSISPTNGAAGGNNDVTVSGTNLSRGDGHRDRHGRRVHRGQADHLGVVRQHRRQAASPSPAAPASPSRRCLRTWRRR